MQEKSKNRSTKQVRKLSPSTYQAESIKQYPIDFQPAEPPDERDNELRKFVMRRKHIEENMKLRRDQHRRFKYIHKPNEKPKVLTGLAIDSNGKLLKRKAVKLDSLPKQVEEAPDIKLHGFKRIKGRKIEKEEYEEMLKTKQKTARVTNDSLDSLDRHLQKIKQDINAEK